MTTKQWTLLGAVLGTLATALLALTGTLLPIWAALIASMGAGLYAIARTMQKRASGAEWKTWLRTTEAWGVLLAVVAPVVAAIAGVLPEYAAPIGIVAGVLLKIARMLQSGLPDGPNASNAANTAKDIFP